MAILSTHTLNAADGSHAGNVGVTLSRIGPGSERTLLFSSQTDAGGRLSESIVLTASDCPAQFELAFQTGLYFASNLTAAPPGMAQQEVVLRFAMPDPEGAYHMPLIMAPHGCSAWWSR